MAFGARNERGLDARKTQGKATMTEDPIAPAASETPDPRPLSPAALRALAEAEERRRAQAAEALPPEQGGRDGPDPVRYGDWERNGIISDF